MFSWWKNADGIFAAFSAGWIDGSEMHRLLDAIGIRGDVDERGEYTGYDYRNQIWLRATL